jgi:hypothetical protein
MQAAHFLTKSFVHGPETFQLFIVESFQIKQQVQAPKLILS